MDQEHNDLDYISIYLSFIDLIVPSSYVTSKRFEWNKICSQHISELGKFLTNYRFEVKCLIIDRVHFRTSVATALY